MGETLGVRQEAPHTPTAESHEWLRLGDVVAVRAAVEQAVDARGLVPVGVAWRAAAGLHHAGNFDEALKLVGRADVEGAHPADLSQLAASQSAASWARGSQVESRAAADRALALALECGDDAALASAYVAQGLVCAAAGDRNSVRRSYDLALAHAEAADDRLSQARVLNNIGSFESEEGRHEQALPYLEDALTRCGDQAELRISVAMVRLTRSEALLGLGRVDEALADLQHARVVYRELEGQHLGHVLVGIGDTNRIRGNASLAAAAYREAVDLVTDTQSALALVPALSGLARTCFADDPDEARTCLKQALQQPAALGSVSAVLAAGWLALADHSHAEAAEFGLAAEREAGRRHDLPRLTEALELRVLAMATDPAGGPSASLLDRLAEAATIWADIGSPIGLATNQVLVARLADDRDAEHAARGRLRALGVRDDANRIAGQLFALAHVGEAGLEIRTLGSFAVLRGGEPVPTAAWQSRTARDLIKILSGRRGRGVSREVLCEHLWPGVRDAGGRLSVALSTARAVLDPDKQHSPRHFLDADRSSVRLDLEHLRLDAAVFTEAARAALASARAAESTAVERLERAAAMYTGPYLEDDLAEEWAVDVREELRAASVEVRRALVAAIHRAGEPERAIPWLMGLLADDPYDEPSHRDLVGTLVAARRYGEARRCYAAYTTRMAEIDASVDDFETLARG